MDTIRIFEWLLALVAALAAIIGAAHAWFSLRKDHPRTANALLAVCGLVFFVAVGFIFTSALQSTVPSEALASHQTQASDTASQATQIDPLGAQQTAPDAPGISQPPQRATCSGAGLSEFTNAPPHPSEIAPNAPLEDIEGVLRGLDNPERYKVVVYARTDHWYVQPNQASARADVDACGSWRSRTRPGFEYAVLVVQPNYAPLGELEALPGADGRSIVLVVRER